MVDLRNRLVETGVFDLNTHFEKYLTLIELNSTTKYLKFTTHQHHVIPRCYFILFNLECDDSPQNLVHLTLSDHVLAHYHLVFCCNNSVLRLKLICAALLLSRSSSFDVLLTQLLAEEFTNLQLEVNNTYKNQPGFNKNKVIITDLKSEKMIRIDLLPTYILLGWKRGRMPFSEEDKRKKSESHKNRKVMHKGDLTLHVKIEDVPNYIQEGFSFGQSLKTKQLTQDTRTKNNKPSTLHKVMFDGENYHTVKLHEVEEHLREGWILKGRPPSEDLKLNIGQKNKIGMSGRVLIHKGDKRLFVKPHEVDSYIADGFILGTGISTKLKPSVWMNNREENKRVDPQDVQFFESQGWVRGMLKGNKLIVRQKR